MKINKKYYSFTDLIKDILMVDDLSKKKILQKLKFKWIIFELLN